MKPKVGKNDWYTITILCSKCQTSLYKYKKEGGGELIKCYVSNILEDYTNGDCVARTVVNSLLAKQLFITGQHTKSLAEK